MRRLIVPIAVVALVAALIAVELLSGSSGTAGRPAPPLPSAVLRPPRTTIAMLRGKPALINFWASWCGPCRQEAPELERFQRALHGSAHLVGVDYTDQVAPAGDFVRRYRWTFPLLSDPDGIYGARYGITGLPTTVVLDPSGRIVRVLHGPQRLTNLRAALHAAVR